MEWHPDVPDLPIRKPKQIEKLEKMDRIALDSMPGIEIKETVDEIAHAVAMAYQQQIKDADYDGCIEVVSVALSVTGSSIGGRVGTSMIASSDSAAKSACDLAFPKKT